MTYRIVVTARNQQDGGVSIITSGNPLTAPVFKTISMSELIKMAAKEGTKA